jgi:hypothetical protein
LKDPRIYGIRTPGDRHWRRREFLLEGLLGPVLGESARPATRVRVRLAHWRNDALACGEYGLEWKRRGLWHNARRNDAIAEIATSLADRDEPRLWTYGLSPDVPVIGPGPSRRPRVTVVVESPEHARELARRLPGWRVLAGQPVRRPGRDGDGDRDGRRAVAENPGPPDRTIATLVGFRDLPRLEADVVLRADGTRGPIGLPGTSRGRRAGDIALVDLCDGFDDIAERATADRVADYLARGWEVTGGPARGRPAEI